MSGWEYRAGSDGDVEAWFTARSGATIRLWVEQEKHPRVSPCLAEPYDPDDVVSNQRRRSHSTPPSVADVAFGAGISEAAVRWLMEPRPAASWLAYAPEGGAFASSADVLMRATTSPARRLVPLDVRAAAMEALRALDGRGLLDGDEWLRGPLPDESSMAAAGRQVAESP